MRRQWVKRDCTFEQDEALDYQNIQRNILRPGNKLSFSIPTSRSFPKHIRRYYLFLIITFKLYNFINQTKKKKGIYSSNVVDGPAARTHTLHIFETLAKLFHKLLYYLHNTNILLEDQQPSK